MNGQIAIFGEVLFDVFPGNQRALGGAPFNVAWHLHGFGLAPVFISAVGDDAPGREVHDRMQSWGMTLQGLQTDAQHPTGTVEITMNGTQHTFSILPSQAYDHINASAALAATASGPVELLYHGSLALRDAASREAFQRLRTELGATVFVDINLRDPWWTPEQVEADLRHARWAKVNDDELETLAGFGHIAADALAEVADDFRRQRNIEILIVTRGADGALATSDDATVAVAPAPVDKLVDTVGAGDAFSAVTIAGLLQGWPLAQTLERANAFAARICAQRGATALNPELYRNTHESWR